MVIAGDGLRQMRVRLLTRAWSGEGEALITPCTVGTRASRRSFGVNSSASI